jgi:hypothetical protein
MREYVHVGLAVVLAIGIVTGYGLDRVRGCCDCESHCPGLGDVATGVRVCAYVGLLVCCGCNCKSRRNRGVVVGVSRIVQGRAGVRLVADDRFNNATVGLREYARAGLVVLLPAVVAVDVYPPSAGL